ncbi:MAG: amidohydrolase [Deltaproteobacteria bacterium]|nr:amidohydrolase [Deltaproteobacteria bacterium]
MAHDLLIENGTFVTVNPAFDVIENGILAMDGGCISRIEKRPPGAPLPEAREHVDAGGALVLPGLVNTHTHLPMSLFRGLADDLPLQQWLHDHIFPAEARFVTPDTVRTGTLLSCAELLLSGSTTCCDGYFFEDQVAEAVLSVGIRAVAGQGVIDFPAPGVPDPSRNVNHALDFAKKWRGVSPLISPSIFCHSPYTCSRETLVRAKQAAADMDLIFQIHAAETRSELEQIRAEHQATPIGYLDNLGIVDEKTLLVHTIWVDGDDIDIIAERKAPVSVTTESEMKLASGIAPIPAFLDAGITVGLGTDSCASNNDLDMFQEMDMTAKLHKVSLKDPTIGSLEVGKQADVIILEGNQPHLIPLYSPASHLVYSARGSDVRDVFVAGKALVRNRRLTSIDIEAVMAEAVAIGRNISKKGDGKKRDVPNI